MSSDPALKIVLEREEAARDVALLARRRADDQLARAREQAQQLEAHRTHTIASWNERSREHASIEMLHTYRGFMQRLDQALAQQRVTVDRLLAQAERARALLLAAEIRVAAVGKLLERRAQAEHRVAQQRDQKRGDEAAQRAGWRASQASDFGSMY